MANNYPPNEEKVYPPVNDHYCEFCGDPLCTGECLEKNEERETPTNEEA